MKRIETSEKTSEISQEVQRSYVEEMEYRVHARFTRETQLETPWEASTLSVGEVVIIASDEMDIGDSRRAFSRKRWYHPRCKGENGTWREQSITCILWNYRAIRVQTSKPLIHSPPFTNRSGMQRSQHAPECRKLQKSKVDID